MVKKKNLNVVLAFYKCNLSGGVSVGFELSDPWMRQEFHNTCEKYQKVWENSNEDERAHWVESYIHQIEAYGAMEPNAREAGWDWLIMINIWFLEKHGFIESDQFNGCVFAYLQ